MVVRELEALRGGRGEQVAAEAGNEGGAAERRWERGRQRERERERERERPHLQAVLLSLTRGAR